MTTDWRTLPGVWDRCECVQDESNDWWRCPIHGGPGRRHWPHGDSTAAGVDRRPHSRACKAPYHPHGSACSSNCPTCGGKPESKTETLTASGGWCAPAAPLYDFSAPVGGWVEDDDEPDYVMVPKADYDALVREQDRLRSERNEFEFQDTADEVLMENVERTIGLALDYLRMITPEGWRHAHALGITARAWHTSDVAMINAAYLLAMRGGPRFKPDRSYYRPEDA